MPVLNTPVQSPARRLGTVAALLVLTVALAHAEEINLAPSADTTIFYDLGGSGDYDDVADSRGDSLWTSVVMRGVARRALIQFDLPALPAGQQVVSAALDLYLDRSQGEHDVALHRVQAPWGEGSSQALDGLGAPATAGDATWTWADYLVRRWEQPGADFVPTPSAVTPISAEGQTYRWSSPELLADVQTWLADPGSNHGWILIGREDLERNAFRFSSREGLRPPQLVLQLAPIPEVGTAAMLLAGLMVTAWLGRARRRS